jgi:hypothetical protein
MLAAYYWFVCRDDQPEAVLDSEFELKIVQLRNMADSFERMAEVIVVFSALVKRTNRLGRLPCLSSKPFAKAYSSEPTNSTKSQTGKTECQHTRNSIFSNAT